MRYPIIKFVRAFVLFGRIEGEGGEVRMTG